MKKESNNFDKKEEIGVKAKDVVHPGDVIEDKDVKRWSEDWRFVEFHLQSSLSYEVDIIKIKPIFNEHMINSFDKRIKNRLYTYAWKSFSGSDDKKAKISQLRSRGFDIPNNANSSGMIFTSGALDEESRNMDNDDKEIAQEIESTYVLCKIIIGRSYCKIVKSGMGMDLLQEQKISDYDTILYYPADGANTNQNHSNIYGTRKTYKYKVFDSSNVLPMFFVEFKQRDEQHVSNSGRKCTECESKEAELYCVNDDALLCTKCSDEIHQYDFNKDHNTIPVQQGDRMFLKTGKCVFDPNNDVEFYCKTCNLAICSYCKVLGTHSKGNAANHVLEDISEVYIKNSPIDSNSEFCEFIKQKCDDYKKKAVDSLARIKTQVDNLRSKVMEDASEQIDYQFKKEMTAIRDLSVKNLRTYINAINEKLVLKYYLNWLELYFNERLSHLAKNKAEKLWIFYIYSDFVKKILRNKRNTYTEFKIPENKEYDTEHTNEFRIIQYRFEDSSYKKLSKEDNKKVFDQGGKQLFDRTQKSDLKTDLIRKIINLRTEKKQANENNLSGENYDTKMEDSKF